MILSFELIAGTIDIVFSSASSSEAGSGNMTTAQSQSILAQCLIIAASITGIICYIPLIKWFASMWNVWSGKTQMVPVQGLDEEPDQMGTIPAADFKSSQQVTE